MVEEGVGSGPSGRPDEARRFQALIEKSWDAIALMGADGTIQYASPSNTRVLGYLPEELIGRTAFELMHPEDLPHTSALFAELLQQPGATLTAEYRYRHQDGSWRWIEGTDTNMLHDPSVQAIVCNYRDITERKQAEEGIRIITAGARCILWHAQVEEQGPDRLAWDLKVFDEEAAQRFFPVEIPPGLSYVQAWYESRPPEDKAQMHERANREVRVGRSYRQEFRCRRIDGEIRWLAEEVQIERLAPGRWQAVGVCMDITERKRAEVALQESEERTRARLAELDHLYAATPVGLGLVDTDLRYVRVNERLAAINGRPAAEHIGRSLREVIPAVAPLVEPIYRGVIETGEPALNLEIRGITPAAPLAERDFLLNYYPLKSPEGAVQGVSIVIQDITERKRAEEERAQLLVREQAARAEAERLYQEAQEADRRKDEFLAMLAHELRNPLAPILNAAQVLRLRGPNDPALQRAREVVERQAQHLARLVDDLLDVSRITHGKIELRREPVDLAAVVREAVQTSRPLVEARQHQLTVLLPLEPVRVEGDATRLEQILVNLLNNAAKYTEPGGHIWLTVEKVDRRWLMVDGSAESSSAPPSTLPPQPSTAVIRVRDTGVGIAPEMLPHVFDLFTQADRSLDRSQGGLGIGLTLVRRLVELHGGTVHAKSAGLGQGSEFVVHLTALEEARVGRVAPQGGERPERPARILVVEDHADAAETLAELLELWGHEVRTVHNGAAALEEAVRYQPEVVLLDIGLPGMNGYEVARRLREQEHPGKTMLVALTGYGQEEDRRRAMAAGFDYHLVKPVDLAGLRLLLGGAAASSEEPPSTASGEPDRKAL